MFVRIKKRGTSGDYGYLVENYWINGSSRQRIKTYLGKVHGLNAVHDISIDVELPKIYSDVILALVKAELTRHGFQEKDGVYFLDKLFVNLNLKTVHDSHGRKVVLKLNDGFLCDHYLNELLNCTVDSEEQVKGIKLANLLVSSGLKVKPEMFVEVYKKLQEANPSSSYGELDE